MLNGYKTYLVCIAAIITAFYQVHLGTLTVSQAWDMIMAVLAAAGLRHGITTRA